MTQSIAGAQPDGSDKRFSERLRRRLMVRFGTRSAEKTAFTRNISATGMFLQTNHIIQPGSTIQVWLKFPDREFSMWAKVMWAKRAPAQLAGMLGSGMGVHFVEPGTEWLDYYRGWARKQ